MKMEYNTSNLGKNSVLGFFLYVPYIFEKMKNSKHKKTNEEKYNYK